MVAVESDGRGQIAVGQQEDWLHAELGSNQLISSASRYWLILEQAQLENVAQRYERWKFDEQNYKRSKSEGQ